ncbi:hypothetical protein EVAR_25126_1 [Eumeta japonica]|uniref:Uncharacterized protein n=1 Tax=Eumeta variegata TaxID=151549 RepID=A0A4C1XP43_EUMVA|nr:hypothetical protein EVAR_25126_1 [Eumeta japonica]
MDRLNVLAVQGGWLKGGESVTADDPADGLERRQSEKLQASLFHDYRNRPIPVAVPDLCNSDSAKNGDSLAVV